MKLPRPQTPSEALLVAVNLLPLAGAALWGWKVFDILLLYWIENVIIGLLNVFKMLAVMNRKRLWIAIPIVPFFFFHYGMFTMVHGVFVIGLFGLKLLAGQSAEWHEVETLLRGIAADPFFLLVALGLVVSHGFSFIFNFLRGGEVDRTSLTQLMRAPYGRIVALHITIILGGGVTMMMGEPIWALGLLTIFKTIGDVRAHRRSHEIRTESKTVAT
ncbi:MAG: DUF6498-containing protein [Alphaproteobacteria bacterium]|nr:DUF6498-containing protein [Alphaproteobacteria bacterium]